MAATISTIVSFLVLVVGVFIRNPVSGLNLLELTTTSSSRARASLVQWPQPQPPHQHSHPARKENESKAGTIQAFASQHDIQIFSKQLKMALVTVLTIGSLTLSTLPAHAKGGPGGGSSGGSSSSSYSSRISREDSFDNAILGLCGVVVAGTAATNVISDVLFDKRFNATNFDANVICPPTSGRYVGQGDGQTIETQLRFSKKGKLTGKGRDSRDGAYTVSGNWCAGQARWVETYETNKLVVTVRAKLLENDRIQAAYTATYDGGSSYGSFWLKRAK